MVARFLGVIDARMARVLGGVAVAVLLLAVAAGCSPAEEAPAPEPEPVQPQLAQAYYDAAAFGASHQPPFDVYWSSKIPEDLALVEAIWTTPTPDPAPIPGDLTALYEQGERSVTIGVAVGDVGDEQPLETFVWGSDGDVAVYPDAWDLSYIAIGPSQSDYKPYVRTIGLSLAELEEVLAGMEVVQQ